MTGFSASAPGKAVLCGEYAVLRGAPAVAMAVDRRAGVCLSPADDRCHRFEAPGFVSGHWRFRADSQGRIEWLDEPPRAGFHLLEETFRACLSDELPPLLISIDTREFFDGQSGEKLGFGSSAAATVALVAGLSGQHEQSEACWPVARAVHRSLQGGRGSGVDVATSCFGGVITYRGQSEGPPESQEWPEGLEFRFLYSGRSADTEAAIRKLDDTSSADAAWQNLMAAAENSAAAWGSGNTGDILGAFRQYTETLAQFSKEYDLGVFSAGHDVLVDLATASGTVYKPCGAGGGDIGIALASSIDDIERFCERAREHGFRPLNVQLDKRGVLIEPGKRDE